MVPLQGCQLLSKVGIGGTTKQPFTTDYTLSQGDYDFFVGSDTVDTAIVHSPFYPGNQPLPSQNTAEYENARWEKVKAIVADADALVKAAKAAEPALTALRSEYVSFLEKVRTSEPKAATFIGSSMTTVTALGIKEILAERGYAALMATEATTAYASTMRDYLKVVRAVEYGSLMLEDANTLVAHAALISQGIGGDGSAGAKAAAAEFDAKATRLVADAVAALEPVAAGIDRIDQGMTLLASGDYYFSREALGWMASESAKLGPQVETLAPRGDLTQEQVGDIKTAYGAFQEWNAALSAELASLDTSRLVAVEGAIPFGIMPFLGTAYAAEGDVLYNPGADYSSSIAAMSKAPEQKQGLLSATWSGVKTIFGAAKTTLGVTLDATAAGVKNIETIGCGLYYGNDRWEIWDELKANAKVTADNYKNGVSGSTILTTANGYLDAVEAGAGETIGGWTKSGIEKTWGKGKIADGVGWATGGLTKVTTGMFTGLAKGIYKVANTKSSTADVASGIVEIGLSCIGGSKVLIKGTQIPGLLKGGFQAVKNAKNAFVNLAGSAGDAKIRGQLTKELGELIAKNNLTKEQAAALVSNTIKVEIAEAVSAMMTRNRAAYIKAIRDLIAAGGTGLKTNFVGGIKSSLQDLLEKGFSKSLQGVLDAGTTVIGGTLSDYIDNLVGSQLDPLLTDLINAALAIPPDPDQMDGSWTGSFVITKVDIPEEYTKQAKEANCAALFKQLEGKSQAMGLKLNTGSGSATMSSGKGSSKGSCEYSGGSISMAFTSNGTTMSFKGTAKLTKEGVKMGGSFSMPYPKTKIMISGTWSATKNKD
jgi:hypothetical protein